MGELHSEVLELFAEFSRGDEAIYQASFYERQRRALYAQQYDAERAKLIRCVPAMRARRAESQSRYEQRKWQRTRANETLREQHNAKRRAAHARLKADPARLTVAKEKQRAHSLRHSQKRRAAPRG